MTIGRRGDGRPRTDRPGTSRADEPNVAIERRALPTPTVNVLGRRRLNMGVRQAVSGRQCPERHSRCSKADLSEVRMTQWKRLAAFLASGVFGVAIWAVILSRYWHAHYPGTNMEGANGMFFCWEFLPLAVITLPFCVVSPLLICLLGGNACRRRTQGGSGGD
jgi:hypothetical protein